MNNKITLYPIYLTIVLAVCFWCFACSSSEQKINAQSSNKTDNTSNRQKSESGSKIFDGIDDPCRFFGEYDSEKPDYKQFYELQNAGYPKAVALDEAVEFFNRLAQCSKVGKTQSPLRPEEIVGAVASWDCAEDVEEFQTKPFDKNICQEFSQIAETGKLPKGAWLDYDGGICPDCNGFTVGIWKIRLYIKLDKNRRDYKGDPAISRLLRLNYASAERNK